MPSPAAHPVFQPGTSENDAFVDSVYDAYDWLGDHYDPDSILGTAIEYWKDKYNGVCEMSRPNRKKQGRELDEKKRANGNWVDNGNKRNGRTQKKHTPSKKHNGGK